MHELTKGIKELNVDPAIERRLLKRVRTIMEAISELLVETNSDLAKL